MYFEHKGRHLTGIATDGTRSTLSWEPPLILECMRQTRESFSASSSSVPKVSFLQEFARVYALQVLSRHPALSSSHPGWPPWGGCPLQGSPLQLQVRKNS